MAKEKIKKVAKALKKASNTHAKQAKSLEAIKLKKGGSAGDVPDNVANPSLYREAKSKAKAKFDVYPSAYANGWMVQEYKRMGGTYKGATGGEVTLDPAKSDLDKDGKLSGYERKRGTAIAKSMARQAKGMQNGGTVMVQSRGCGAIMPNKQKKTRVPRG
jgi:hypothetical protein